VDNVPNTEDEKRVEKRRRIEFVKANDTVQADRMKARVLSKKFGEQLPHEKLSIFNKKLKIENISMCVPVGVGNLRGKMKADSIRPIGRSLRKKTEIDKCINVATCRPKES